MLVGTRHAVSENKSRGRHGAVSESKRRQRKIKAETGNMKNMFLSTRTTEMKAGFPASHFLCPSKIGGRAKRRGAVLTVFRFNPLRRLESAPARGCRDAACSVRFVCRSRTLHAASLPCFCSRILRRFRSASPNLSQLFCSHDIRSIPKIKKKEGMGRTLIIKICKLINSRCNKTPSSCV